VVHEHPPVVACTGWASSRDRQCRALDRRAGPLQATTGRVFVHHAIVDYVVRLVVATRNPGQHGMSDVAQWVSYAPARARAWV